MPMYYFECPVCKSKQRRILSREEAKGDLPCKKDGCSGKLKRTPKPATSTVVETLDNGYMARRVTRIADAERIMWERAHPAPNEFVTTTDAAKLTGGA